MSERQNEWVSLCGLLVDLCPVEIGTSTLMTVKEGILRKWSKAKTLLSVRKGCDKTGILNMYTNGVDSKFLQWRKRAAQGKKATTIVRKKRPTPAPGEHTNFI